MDKLFPVQMNVLPRTTGALAADWYPSGFKLGRIEAILEPGKFVVELENGVRVKATGSRALKLDSRVRVFPPAATLAGESEKEQPLSLREKGVLWKALFPLGFGGRKASARLQVFLEERPEALWDKNPRAVYFVVWTKTEKLGEIQWCLYLKGRQVSLQVFAEAGEKSALRELVSGVERNLRGLGFVFATPPVFLNRPFKAPEGFRLNVRG